MTKDSLYADSHTLLARRHIVHVLQKVFDTYLAVLAPMAPLLAEEIHHFAQGRDRDPSADEVAPSVFEKGWPEPVSQALHRGSSCPATECSRGSLCARIMTSERSLTFAPSASGHRMECSQSQGVDGRASRRERRCEWVAGTSQERQVSTVSVLSYHGDSALTESARRHCRRIGSSAEAAVVIDGASETLRTHGKSCSEDSACVLDCLLSLLSVLQPLCCRNCLSSQTSNLPTRLTRPRPQPPSWHGSTKSSWKVCGSFCQRSS